MAQQELQHSPTFLCWFPLVGILEGSEDDVKNVKVKKVKVVVGTGDNQVAGDQLR